MPDTYINTGEPIEPISDTPPKPSNVNIGLPNFLEVPIYTNVLAVYNPIVYEIKQSVYPYDGSTQVVTLCRQVNQSEISYFALGGTELYVELSGNLNYAHWINFTTGTIYNGVYKVKAIVNQSKYIIDTAFVGVEVGNVVGKFLENFKCLTKIKSGLKEHTMFAYPDADNYFYFDVAPYCSSLVTYKLLDAVPTTLLTRDENNIKLCNISHAWQYTEYDSNALPFKKYSDFGIGNNIHVVNTHLQYIESERLRIINSTLTFNNYWAVYNSGTPVDFLTFSPRTINISEGESYQLSFFKTLFPTDANWIVKVKYYDNTDTVISTDADSLQYNLDKQIWIISCGMSYLNVPTNCTYYTVHIETENEPTYPIITNIFRFNIKKRCGDSVRLLWQNKMLGIDGFTFNGKISRTEKSRRKETKSRINYLRVIGDKEWHTYDINTDVEYTINTGLVNREVREWLRELVTTTNVWWELLDEFDNTIRLPVRIINDNYSSINNNEDNLVNISLVFSMSFDEVNRNG